MFNFLKGAPAEAIPPPPNAPTQPQRAEAIKQAKEAGNVGLSVLLQYPKLTYGMHSKRKTTNKRLPSTPVQPIWPSRDLHGNHPLSRERKPSWHYVIVQQPSRIWVSLEEH
jgi:hypothetical protein